MLADEAVVAVVLADETVVAVVFTDEAVVTLRVLAEVGVIFADCKVVVFIAGAEMICIIEYSVFCVPLSESIKHCFLTTGRRTLLGLGLDLLQISLGTSRHCSVGDNLITSLFCSHLYICSLHQDSIPL